MKIVLAVEGRSGKETRFTLDGAVRAFAEPMALDLNAHLRDIRLTRFSPYSSHYAGHPIDEGFASLKISYTVDDEASMRRFLELGVDGIFTNLPDRLRQILDEAV